MASANSSRGAQAVSRGAPEHDGAICEPARPGVVDNEVMSTMGAHQAVDMPGLIRQGIQRKAGVASSPAPSPSSARPFLDGPLSPRTAWSFDPADSSPQLPSFINNSSSAASFRDSSSYLFPIHGTCRNPNPTVAPFADCLPLFSTFYLSPSASRSSRAFSLSSSDISGNSCQTQRIMPGQTYDALPEPRFPSPVPNDYFSLAYAPTDLRATDDTTQLRPRSAGSRGTERTGSPLSFTRWARRHHHHSDCHNGEEEARMLKGRDRSSAERKAVHKSSPKHLGRARSRSLQKRPPQAVVPQMTREEFEALPLAIQRKYFSTLERLRFAQESGIVDGISQHYDDISNFKRRKPRQDRSASEHLVGRTHRGSVFEFHSPTSDSLPLSPRQTEATREAGACCEDQVALAVRRRASVILDAADEAVFKLNQRASRRNLSTAADTLTPPRSPAREDMDSRDGSRTRHDQSGDGQASQSFFDSFRWMEEEEDLDLRLFLDDYHANLREGAVTTKQRPSFRRHMSINKIPFGRRSSVSSTRPGTNDAMSPTSPFHSPAGSVSNGPTHARRKSRALSLITPKHAAQPSITAFDPAAAHYQDPEARLKLRVYLASPQKFDEAVEFGFPSADAFSTAPAVGGDASGLPRSQSQLRMADGSSNMRSFLADDDEDDDNVSLNSDQPSLADPDSPKTPEPFEHKTSRHARYASAGVLNGRELGRKTPELGLYAQAPAASREMTLRMTLTRPDLRAHEDEIYGWQQRQAYQQHSRRPTALGAMAAENRGAYVGIGAHKDSMDRFPEMDHWNGSTTEKGVMRRIWNRVRRA